MKNFYLDRLEAKNKEEARRLFNVEELRRLLNLVDSGCLLSLPPVSIEHIKRLEESGMLDENS